MSVKDPLSDLTIGFVPLADSAPLVVAKEKGFFLEQGLNVSLSKEASWSNIRDKIVFGELDAAHMLAPMLISTSLGIGSVKKQLVTAYSFGLNGNAVSVSNDLFQAMLGFDKEIIHNPKYVVFILKKVIESRQAYGLPKLRFGVVFPFSMHNLLLRYWLEVAEIDPDKDVDIVVVPPSSVVKALQDGLIDGYCVGEPWNTHAVKQQVGVTIITGYDIWNAAPEKVLGVTREWAELNPSLHQKLIVALYRASEWIADESNQDELLSFLSQEAYLNLPKSSLENVLKGEVCHPVCNTCRLVPHFSMPFAYQANMPWLSHAEWMLNQLKAANLVSIDESSKKLAKSFYFPQVYRQALVNIGVEVPAVDSKAEGSYAKPWTLEGFEMAEDAFIDGKMF